MERADLFIGLVLIFSTVAMVALPSLSIGLARTVELIALSVAVAACVAYLIFGGRKRK